jgi:hypothetical protein
MNSNPTFYTTSYKGHFIHSTACGNRETSRVQSPDGTPWSKEYASHVAAKAAITRHLKEAVIAARPYQPRTGARCSCRPGIERDNCPQCEGTGWRIDFAAIRAR